MVPKIWPKNIFLKWEKNYKNLIQDPDTYITQFSEDMQFL